MHRGFLLVFCFVFCWGLELGGFLYLRACAPAALELIAPKIIIEKHLVKTDSCNGKNGDGAVRGWNLTHFFAMKTVFISYALFVTLQDHDLLFRSHFGTIVRIVDLNAENHR